MSHSRIKRDPGMPGPFNNNTMYHENFSVRSRGFKKSINSRQNRNNSHKQHRGRKIDTDDQKGLGFIPPTYTEFNKMIRFSSPDDDTHQMNNYKSDSPYSVNRPQFANIPITDAEIGFHMRRGYSRVIPSASMIIHHNSVPTCVDIPRSLTLCQGIGYGKMRLPNLLNHDSLNEVVKQASSWVPLLSVSCHPDARIFLCSLYSPVCLDRPIYPCRSLCRAVKGGCESRIKLYGFPWPKILECETFPPDNDLCIASQTVKAATNNQVINVSNSSQHFNSRQNQMEKHHTVEKICEPCPRSITYESILENFCRSDVVIKIKNHHKKFTFTERREDSARQTSTHNQLSYILYNKQVEAGKRRVKRTPEEDNVNNVLLFMKDYKVKRIFKVGTFLKLEFDDPKMIYMNSRRKRLSKQQGMLKCACNKQTQINETRSVKSKGDNRYFLVMGKQIADKIFVNFMTPWDKSNVSFRKAVKKLKNLDCGASQ
ncbi:secreted frizzled-related protein 5-like [Gordionus sp. m RMFG-2023]|uniref:secreted frizzled-related protein 5-like n=1 Tax=Gordionus sp. m RMFG-2023 TaxID=3053472 RepID=UPI0031FCB223